MRGTIVSTPSSVSFWTIHSGRSPLTGAKQIVMAGRARDWRTGGPVGSSRPADPVNRQTV
jgi:hypothetical protein